MGSWERKRYRYICVKKKAKMFYGIGSELLNAVYLREVNHLGFSTELFVLGGFLSFQAVAEKLQA